MSDTDMLYMAALEKRLADTEAENAELKARAAELESKHWNECRQIAHYDDELTKAKVLLKAAVEDFKEINADILTCKYCKWHSEETGECAYCPDDIPCEKICGWKHADEALALIGGGTE